MFEVEMRPYDKLYNEVMDRQYQVQIMTAEMKLCARLGKTPDVLQFKYECRKIWSDK